MPSLEESKWEPSPSIETTKALHLVLEVRALTRVFEVRIPSFEYSSTRLRLIVEIRMLSLKESKYECPHQVFKCRAFHLSFRSTRAFI